MLIGNFPAKLDTEKGRTALPKSIRNSVGQKFIITAGYENSLMIIAKNSWDQVVGDIVNRPFISGPARETDRFLLGSAFEVDLDSQGRFIIPPALRSYAKLSADIVFVGVGNRVEVWDQHSWENYQEYLDKNIERISQDLNEASKSQK
jgi:MraZ protein